MTTDQLVAAVAGAPVNTPAILQAIGLLTPGQPDATDTIFTVGHESKVSCYDNGIAIFFAQPVNARGSVCRGVQQHKEP
jgi:hypothetical protein